MQKRIARRLVDIIPHLVNHYEQRKLEFLACGVLYYILNSTTILFCGRHFRMASDLPSNIRAA